MKVMIDKKAGAQIPYRAHKDDAGLDLMSPYRVYVQPHSRAFIDTGIHIELPKNTVGMVKSRSGLNRKGIQAEGVIDEGYRGSIGVTLYNHTDKVYPVEIGERIAQLVIIPCVYVELEEVESLGKTERGEKGFGSTGM